MDARDIALQSVVPTVMVPRYTDFEALSIPGHRFLMTGNGVWLEVNREWLYARVQLTEALEVALPYGLVTAELQFKCGKLPKPMVYQFTEKARLCSPNECAAWIVWNQRTGVWRLQMLDDEISADRDHVSVNLPALGEDEYMVLDLHSHGEHTAYFSDTDNADDKGSSKISGVIGNLDKVEVTTAFRLCLNGVFIEMPFNGL